MKLETDKYFYITAHTMASDPDLFSLVAIIGHTEYECMGYSRNYRSIRFARLVEVGNMKLRQINRYIEPDRIITVLKG